MITANITPSECTSRLRAIGDALYALGGKWTIRIIVSLMEGNSRFNEIQRSISGISPRVLSAELKELELNGFIQREVYTGSPIIINYTLTDYASSLHDILDALASWGTKHREKIREERHVTSVDPETMPF